MRWGRVAALLVKETIDALRDFRTLFAMVLMPVVFVPGLIIGFSALSLKALDRQSEEPVKIGIIGQSASLERFVFSDSGFDVARLAPVDPQTIEKLVNACAVDLILVPAPGFDADMAAGKKATLTLHYDQSCDNYSRAYSAVEERLQTLQKQVISIRVQERGMNSSLLEPFTIDEQNHATPHKLGGFTLAQILPILLILIAMQAAFHPAIDMVVGEKDRKTLELLFVSPLRPLEILMGKFLSVVGISYGASMLNLASVLFFFRVITKYYPEVDVSVSLGTLLLLMLLVLPVAAMFTALAMGFSAFTRSYKEAQSYLTPVFIVAMLPALYAVTPGVAFTTKTALLPIGSAVLALRDVLLQKATPIEILWALAYHVGLGLLFLWISTRLLEAEEVLFAPTGVPWKSIIRMKSPDAAPTIWEVLFLYLAVFMGTLLVGSLLYSETATGFAVTIMATEIGVILGFTLLLIRLFGYNVKNTLGLRFPGWWNLLAGPVMALGGTAFTMGLAFFLKDYLPPPKEFSDQLMAGIEKIGVWGSLFLLAFLPALCEETLFRGAILSAVRRRMSILPASLFVGVLFGLMHFQAPLRVLIITIVGTLFTYLALRTKSIYPSMLGHLTNNGIAVAIGLLVPSLDTTAQSDLRPSDALLFILVGVGFFSIAMLMLSMTRREVVKTDDASRPATGV